MTFNEVILNKFSRVTSGGRYIPELDGMRTIAISLVVIGHIHQVAGQWLDSSSQFVQIITGAHFGVELFFVISGFILALPFRQRCLGIGKEIKLKDYYVRRLSRLEPPYLLHLIIILIGSFLAGRSITDLLPHLLSSVFYLSNFIEGRFSSKLLNGVTWSLEIEVQFYVIAPFVARVFYIRRDSFRIYTIFVGLMCIFALKYILNHLFITSIPVTLLEYFQYFSVGFLVADRYAVKVDCIGNIKSDCVAIAAWIGLFILFYIKPPAQSLFAAILLYFAVYYSLVSIYIRQILGNVYIRTIGGMCYSIYLLHMPIIDCLFQHFGTINLTNDILKMTIESIIFGLPVIFISAIFFYFVEKPCMKKNWWVIFDIRSLVRHWTKS